MSKSAKERDKPVILSSAPSANWKQFLTESGMGSKRMITRKQQGTKRKYHHSPDTELISFNYEDHDSHKLFERLPKAVGIDCEMVGVSSPKRDMLARVSVVDMHGNCVYDKFVTPTEKVLDYRTWVSGIRPRDLQKGEQYDVVREQVASILKDKIVVGHSVSNDFKVLKIKHPKHLIRDSSYFPVFREMFNNKTPSLRNLARVVLGVNIQSGEHSSVQDAKAAVQLYTIYRREWEEYIHKKYENRRLQKFKKERKSVPIKSNTESEISE